MQGNINWQNNKFGLGQIVVTRGINEKMKNDNEFIRFVQKSLNRYIRCDWGDSCDEDAASNDEAVKQGERILAVYNYDANDKIWIITEWDRSITTILFPDEY